VGLYKLIRIVSMFAQVNTLLDHIVRMAGGEVHNQVIPPAPRIIDRQLMFRKLNGAKALKDFKDFMVYSKEKERQAAIDEEEALRLAAEKEKERVERAAKKK